MILATIELFNNEDKLLELKPSWNEFSYSWTCVFVFVLSFVMVLPKDMSVYNKINSIGMIFFLMVIISIFVVGIDSMLTTDYTHS